MSFLEVESWNRSQVGFEVWGLDRLNDSGQNHSHATKTDLVFHRGRLHVDSYTRFLSLGVFGPFLGVELFDYESVLLRG